MGFIYSYIFLPKLILLAHIAALFSKKIKVPLFERYHILEKIDVWLKLQKDSVKESVVIHSSSMGEFEHIKPLIKSIKERYDLNVIVTFFSPSGYDNVKQFSGVDLFLYLPFDFKGTWEKFYKRLNTKLLIISKHDVWPNQIKVANEKNITSILVNASIGLNSSRSSFLAKLIIAPVYRCLNKIFVISDEHRQRLQKVFNCTNMEIVGDTKFDQVLFRKEQNKNKRFFNNEWNSNQRVIAFGSLWPQDAEHTLIVTEKILSQYADVKVVIVPHQPSPEMISFFLKYFEKTAIDIFSEGYDVKNRVLIINKIGVLADIYKNVDIAYVGGSFKQGIHNVMEPAIYGLPVIFGPTHTNSFEAEQLLKQEGAVVIKNKDDFENVITKFLDDNNYKIRIGRNAYQFALKNTGASKKIIKFIDTAISYA